MPAPGLEIYEFGSWEVDPGRRELRSSGVPVPIGGRAFEIVELLVRSAGDLVTKNDLMDRIWPGAIVEDNTLQVHISAIRKALGADRNILKTASGRGYRLLGDWKIRHESAPAERVARESLAAPAPTFASNLPAATADLIGRDVAVQELQNLLSAYRVVTLTGPGGIGKTALMLEVARSLSAAFAETCIVEAASLSDPDLLASAVAGNLGLNLAGEEISFATIARAIGKKKLLLILDNCEHVIDAMAELAETVVRRCPGATIIATTREVLRIDGEHVYRVPPLSVPPERRREVREVLEYAAAQLFIAKAKSFGADLAPDTTNLNAIAAICHRLDGIPLAIELAAARAAVLGAPQVAALLDDQFGVLAGGRRTARPRHQTLRATLDWSYNLLPDAEAKALRCLSVFAADFSLDAAVTVVGELVAPSIVDHIVNLVAKSLIVADLRDSATEYRLLDTTRRYALEKLRHAGEYRQAARRHAEYFCDFFAQADGNGRPRTQAGSSVMHGRHIADARRALDWSFSADGDPSVGVALTVAVVPLLVQLSLLRECRERVELALASLDHAAPATARLRMQLFAALGWSLMYGVGRAREAGSVWTTTLELADQLDDADYRLRALWGLCIDQFNNGEFLRALDFARRFASLAETSADPSDLATADRIIATTLHFLGDQKSARDHIDRVLVRLATLAERPQVVRFRFDVRVSTHYFLARILWLQGFADQAIRLVGQNIEEGRAIGHALTFCSVLGQAACPIAFLAGDFDTAELYCAMMLDHTEHHQVRLWQVWARCFNGMLMIQRGTVAPGLNILRSELEQVGDAKFLPRFLLPLGEFAMGLGRSGNTAAGLAIVEEALARCEARHEGWYLAELLRVKGELLLKQSADRSAAPAEACFNRALELAQQQTALFWELRSALSLVRLRMSQERRREARSLLAPVFDKFTEGFSIADVRDARALLDALA